MRIFLFHLFLIGCLAKAEARPFEITTYGQQGSAIVLLPGYASSPEVWQTTIERLQANYRLYVLHFAGFAGKAPADQPAFEPWANAVTEWLRLMPDSQVTIIGHSMGGVMALWLAAELSHKVAKVVVVDALPCLSALNNPSFKVDPHFSCEASIRQMTALSDSAFKAMQQQGAPWLVNDVAWQQKLVDWSMQSDRHTLAAVYCSFLQTDMRPKLSQIKARVLVQLEAPFTGYQSAIAAQYETLKGAELVYAPKGLHFVMIDAADWYFESLIAFLKA
ncbi:MAG: alpha/beta hydrolase [Sphingobacteriaceae bacterium]|nr:alpha/beta hydrolase [Sphingobacteriaceae bacterium]